MADEGDPVSVEQYDHTFPKPKNGGRAILASLLIVGGGQLVKGHFRRVLAMWGILAATVVTVPLVASLIDPATNTYSLTGATFKTAYAIIWIYQVWDAAVRP